LAYDFLPLAYNPSNIEHIHPDSWIFAIAVAYLKVSGPIAASIANAARVLEIAPAVRLRAGVNHVVRAE